MNSIHLLQSENQPSKPYKGKRKLHRLSREEKEGILEIVKTTPEPDCWKVIVEKYNLKSIRTAREHYKKYMMFDSNRLFTPDEDKLIVEKVNEIGQKWVAISKLFTDKSDINIRNRYRQLMRQGYKINADHHEPKPFELPIINSTGFGLVGCFDLDPFNDFSAERCENEISLPFEIDLSL